MKVVIGKRAYSMTPQKFHETIEAFKDQVRPFGIYAIEKKSEHYGELRKDVYKSVTQLKKAVREWKAAGYKVYANYGR